MMEMSEERDFPLRRRTQGSAVLVAAMSRVM